MTPDLPPAAETAPVDDLVQDSLVGWVRETCGAREVEVRWLGLHAEVPSGAALHWTGDPCQAQPTLRLSAVVGRVAVAAWTVRPSLAVVVDGVVAPRDLLAGERFVAVSGPVAVDAGAGPTVSGTLVALRPLKRGQAVGARVARAAADAESGQRVDVVVQRGGVRIAAPAVLLRDAFVGRTVQVRNEVTGAVQSGTLIDARTVRIP